MSIEHWTCIRVFSGHKNHIFFGCSRHPSKISTKCCSEDPISISNNNKYPNNEISFSEWIKCKSIRNVCFWLFFHLFSSIHLGCSFVAIRFLVGRTTKFWICSRFQFFLVYLLSVFLLYLIPRSLWTLITWINFEFNWCYSSIFFDDFSDSSCAIAVDLLFMHSNSMLT